MVYFSCDKTKGYKSIQKKLIKNIRRKRYKVKKLKVIGSTLEL